MQPGRSTRPEAPPFDAQPPDRCPIMATATRKNSTPPPPRADESSGESKSVGSMIARAFDATFRFLASLKLAVICLATLAGTLAYGTWFNSAHGMSAATEWIYSARWFALLLAFLGMNILCAALIRYPWTKRQTGFVITHVGLLIVIAGSWWAAQTSDEGQLGMREGEDLEQVDPEPQTDVLSSRPSTRTPAGRSTNTRSRSAPGRLTGRWAGSRSSRTSPRTRSSSRSSGSTSPPGPGRSSCPILTARRWPRSAPGSSRRGRMPSWTPSRPRRNGGSSRPPVRRIQRIVKDLTTAQFIFSYVESHEAFDDFLDPPLDPGQSGVARLHYEDKAGKPRSFDVRIDDAQPRKPIPLPDSDLTASFVKVERVPLNDPSFRQMTGEDVLEDRPVQGQEGERPRDRAQRLRLACRPSRRSSPSAMPRRSEPPQSP